MTAEVIKLYPDATLQMLREIRAAAKECSGFATMTPEGPELTRHIDILDDHDPRARAWSRLQWLHLKASGVVCED